jgi:hypothetical protein
MSRHEEEIDGEAANSLRGRATEGERQWNWTDNYRALTNEAARLRKARLDSALEEISRCERRLVFLRQEVARIRREGEPQLQLGDQPTFAPEWPNQRAPIDRGQ